MMDDTPDIAPTPEATDPAPEVAGREPADVPPAVAQAPARDGTAGDRAGGGRPAAAEGAGGAEVRDAPSRPPPRPARILRQYELVEKVKAYDPDADEELLNRAYVFAMMAHGSQKRASGDPYFHHPVEVAGILADYRFDATTIAAALLHDVVEDTEHGLEEIERLFGPTVAALVDGVTKLGRIRYASIQAKQAENFRKLVLAMSNDIRVLVIKLADRLHNMRTLHYIRDPARRRRIALETLEIYAPLAARIGMQAIKDELEDHAFAELYPDAYASIQRQLERLRRHDPTAVARICRTLEELLSRAGIEAEVKGREKKPYSIWRKMQRKNVSFEQLSDIMAFRVIVENTNQCYAALGVIHGRYNMVEGRFKDYISTPKPNGYRSLHTTVIGPEGRKIEIQIRDRKMDEEAERGVAAHWSYKEGRPEVAGRRYPWVEDLLDILANAGSPEEFLEQTRLELHRDQIFCFTPKGDLVPLPRGATPVDFAYAIHTEVGDHCWAAKVDGRIVPLDTRLENGDQVEIITRADACPSPEWERFVASAKARARIRRFLRSRQREFYLERGRELLERAFAAEERELTERDLEQARQRLDFRSVDDLVAAVGEGRLAARFVLEQVHPEVRRRPVVDETKVIPLKIAARRREEERRREAEGRESPILGLPPGVPFTYARCCFPTRPQPIVGIIRSTRPVAIHRADCPVLERVQDRERRMVELAWNPHAKGVAAPTRYRILAVNEPGALADATAAFGRHEANIVDVRITRRTPEVFEILIEAEVKSSEHADQVLAALRALERVVYAERVHG